jgi:hypothetical protein
MDLADLADADPGDIELLAWGRLRPAAQNVARHDGKRRGSRRLLHECSARDCPDRESGLLPMAEREQCGYAYPGKGANQDGTML